MLKKIFQKRQGIWPLDKADRIALSAGLLVFAVISLATITRASIWFDEAFGAYLIRFDFWQIAVYTASDVHPPLYYWLLKLWSMLLGTSELALRSMSVLFGGVAITFGFLLAKKLFGRQAAWLALLFMVLSPMLIRYSQEMRMYTLVTAIAFAATYVLAIAQESKRRSMWIVYGVLVGLGMWTHYFTALIWLSHWIWRAWVVRQDNKTRQKFTRAFFSKEWVQAHIVAIAVFLPWLPAMIKQVLIVQGGGFWIPPVNIATLPNFFSNVLYYQNQDVVNSWPALGFIVIVLAVVMLAIRLYRNSDKMQRKSYGLILTLAFAPIMLLFVASMPPLRSSFVDRYLIASTVAIALFMAIILAASTKNARLITWQKSIILLVSCAMLFGVYNVYRLGNYNTMFHTSNNTRQTLEAITAKTSYGQPIITDSPWLFYEAVFYDSPAHPIYFIDANTQYIYGSLDMLRDNDQHKIKDLAAFTHDHPVVWYMGRPAGKAFTSPSSSWRPLQQVKLNDSVGGTPAYEAVQYQAN